MRERERVCLICKQRRDYQKQIIWRCMWPQGLGFRGVFAATHGSWWGSWLWDDGRWHFSANVPPLQSVALQLCTCSSLMEVQPPGCELGSNLSVMWSRVGYVLSLYAVSAETKSSRNQDVTRDVPKGTSSLRQRNSPNQASLPCFCLWVLKTTVDMFVITL